MKKLTLLLVVGICLVLGGAIGTLASDETLGSLRQQYLGQTVVVFGVTMELSGKSFLTEWEIVEQPDNAHPTLTTRYKGLTFNQLPDKYKNQTAKVIAVQLNELKLKSTAQTNALGESVSQDAIVDPYIDVIVKFGDGQLAMIHGYAITLHDGMKLSSLEQGEQKEIEDGLPQLIGKNLYAAAWSPRYQPLFKPDTALSEMLKSEFPF